MTYGGITVSHITGTISPSCHPTNGAAAGGGSEGEGEAVEGTGIQLFGQNLAFPSSLRRVISSPISILTSSCFISLRMV